MSIRTEMNAAAAIEADVRHPYTPRLVKMDKALKKNLATIERKLKAEQQGGLAAFFSRLTGPVASCQELVAVLASGQERCSLPTNYTHGYLAPALAGSANHLKEIREATEYCRSEKMDKINETLKGLSAWRAINARCADPAVDVAVDVVFRALNFDRQTNVLDWQIDIVVRLDRPYQQSLHAAHFAKPAAAAPAA